MIKSVLEFHLATIILTTPCIIVGMYMYNFKKIKKGEESSMSVIITSLVFSILPLVNIAIGSRNFLYLLMGDNREDETR